MHLRKKIHFKKSMLKWIGTVSLEQLRERRLAQGKALQYFSKTSLVTMKVARRCSQIFTGGMSNYSRLAMTLGLPKDSPARDLVLATRYYLSQRVEPTRVATGPVKENILVGDSINLFDFPVPQWHREDGGRYINTFQATVTMDPDSGVHNLGIYRGMIGQRDTLPVLLWRAQNWGVHFQKWAERGQKMPVAHVYGWEPSLLIAHRLLFQQESLNTTSWGLSAESLSNW